MSKSARPRDKSVTRIKIESLETRRLLAAFGTPWPDARSLTVSFPADGTAIGNYSNELRQTLDAVADRDQWQESVLRAFQTWAVHADINVGLRNDYDVDFGAPGLSVNDPRFGDFRIGAFPQIGVLANSVPFQPIAGSYSGDIVLNSNEVFTYHDWSIGAGPDPNSQVEGERDLLSLLLHETGNALGLEDNSLDWTVMFRQYTVPKGVLTQDDIDQIQNLYGARTDPYELAANNELQVATIVPTPIGFQADTDIISTNGSLVDSMDVDYYEFAPVTGQSEVTLRLRAAGISLLTSRFEVLDASGQVIATSQSGSVLSNDQLIQIDGLENHSVLYLRVSGLDQDVFSVGDYQLEVDYRSSQVQATDPVAGDYDSGIDSLFTNFALADPELGSNDSVGSAVTLSASDGFATQTRFEIESSISSAGDVDYWKFRSPANVTGRLAIHLSGVGLDQPDLKLRVVDATGQSVGASGRLNADGTWTMVVAQPQANQDYHLRVSVDPNSTVDVGNYVASAEFVASDQQLLLSTDQVSSDIDNFIRWTAQKSKLHRFDLSALGVSNDEGVQLTIYDAHTRTVRLVLSVRSGMARTAFAWLEQGDYILRFTAISRTGDPVTDIAYSLRYAGISDDQDPDGEDPENDPDYDPVNYEYYYYEDPVDPPTDEDPYFEYYYYST